jgi:hemerythrin-like domain-containing protein
MYSTKLLVKEHDDILLVTAKIRKICINILDTNEFDVNIFKSVSNFCKNYADIHHHAKEEKILFKYMLKELPEISSHLITNGMLVEHDLGRMYMMNLKKAIEEYDISPTTEAKMDIMSNSLSYAELLTRHIDKENNILYPYAEKNLNSETLKKIDEETLSFEASGKEIVNELLEELDLIINFNLD